MGIIITARLVDQIGLLLGFVSGILLIPEIINLFPFAKIEKSIEKSLLRIESWAKIPLRYSPPSWVQYSEEERDAIETLTAVRSLIFSIVMVSLLAVGFWFSKIFIVLWLIILIYIVIGNMRKHVPALPLLNGWQKTALFFRALEILIVVTPGVSLVRVILIIVRLIVGKVNKLFSTRDVLRASLTIFAIVAFIISNILQFIATLL